METFFARHTSDLDVDDVWVNQLWEEHRIAVHFPEWPDGTRTGMRRDVDNESTDPRDHPSGGAKAMRALNSIASSGGYVCAVYRTREECLVGKVLPGTPIEPLAAEWRRSSYDNPPRPAALKTLRLVQARVVHPVDHAVLLVGRPIRGTIMRWHAARDTVEALAEGRELPLRLDRLSPDQQEVLVAEFLRTPAAAAAGLPQLAHLLLPTGRTLKDLDILGLATDGRPLCVQVTHHPLKAAEWKVDRLLAYAAGSNAHLLLFCRGAQSGVHRGVRVYPIESAFDAFRKSAGGEAWLARAIRGPLSGT